MGFCLSWVAVHDSTQDAVYADLGFRRTGKFEEFPESPFCGAASKAGWTIVVMNRSSAALDGTVDLARLSKLGDVVACFVEEHVMCSAAAYWSSGSVTWSVVHESSK